MTKQQRTILTVVLSLVVVAAAVAGGILAVQGTKTEQASRPTRQAQCPSPPPCPATPPVDVPPSKPAPQVKPGAPLPSATMPDQAQQSEVQPQAAPAPATTPPQGGQSVTGGKGAGPTAKVKFMELGAEWCGPCRSMKPIIEELKKEYKGKVEFVAIDVDQNKDAAEKYNVSAIPVQLIFQNDKQVFRHVGSISKEDIVKQFKKLGVTPANSK